MNAVEEHKRNQELFLMAIKRFSLSRLDSLGIYIKQTELPTYPVYQVCHYNLYGSRNRLVRFWCQWLRPRLRPEDHKLAEMAFAEASALQQQAFLDAIMDRAKDLGLVEEQKDGNQ